MTDTPLLSVRHLTKRYGARIGCADISFDLFPGEVLGIVGESGSGKSTLLSCLAGHLPPDAGQVIFDTTSGPRDTVTMAEADRRRLARTDWAFVHQNPRDGLRMGVSAPESATPTSVSKRRERWSSPGRPHISPNTKLRMPSCR